MSIGRIFGIAGSAIQAQSMRLNTTASNIANAESVAGPDGKVYKPKQVVFEATPMGAPNDASSAGVRVQPGNPSVTWTLPIFMPTALLC